MPENSFSINKVKYTDQWSFYFLRHKVADCSIRLFLNLKLVIVRNAYLKEILLGNRKLAFFQCTNSAQCSNSVWSRRLFWARKLLLIWLEKVLTPLSRFSLAHNYVNYFCHKRVWSILHWTVNTTASLIVWAVAILKMKQLTICNRWWSVWKFGLDEPFVVWKAERRDCRRG